MSTARTVRAGWFAAGALAALVAGGCSDDGDDEPAGPTTTAEPVAPSLPATAEPGRGFLLLGDTLSVLTVDSCELQPSTDEATGVTTELHAVAVDEDGRTVDVVRSSFTADVATVTDTVSVVDDTGVVLESSRADRDGLQIDLREPNPIGPLLEVDGDTIQGAGVFGPLNSEADDPANVDGELLLRCP